MAKAGRNEPCPCGSGKKYKQCCLAKDEEAARAARPAPQGPFPRPHRRNLFADLLADPIDDGLTAASNAALALIRTGHLDEAERAAHDLLERYPEVHDGYDRLGQVCEARGDHRQAANYYRKVIAFIREHPDDYDPEFETGFHRLVERLDPQPSTKVGGDADLLTK